MEFTGERFVPELHGNFELEHVHRYLFVREITGGKSVLDITSGEGYGAAMLAEATAQVIAQGRGEPVGYIREKRGLYHLAAGGSCSRYEWAKTILEMDVYKSEQVVKELLPAKGRDFPSPARRPSKSGLIITKVNSLFRLFTPKWGNILKIVMSQVG